LEVELVLQVLEEQFWLEVMEELLTALNYLAVLLMVLELALVVGNPMSIRRFLLSPMFMKR